MVSLSQVEENMEIKFKKKYQGAAFMAPCRIYPALWQRHGRDMDMKAIEKKLDGSLPKCYVCYLICLGKIN